MLLAHLEGCVWQHLACFCCNEHKLLIRCTGRKTCLLLLLLFCYKHPAKYNVCFLVFFFLYCNKSNCQLSTTAVMQISIISLGRQGGDKANDLAASESTEGKSIN